MDDRTKSRWADLGSVDRDALRLVRGTLDGQESIGRRADEAEAWRLILTELRAEKDRLARALGWKAKDPMPNNLKYDFTKGFSGVGEEITEPAPSARLFAGTRSLAESRYSKDHSAIVTAQMALSPTN